MVFIAGPRQCGKTTLARSLLKGTTGVYLNWDDPDHQREILKRTWHESQRLIVLDEIHKYPKWKAWLKGTYDTKPSANQFLVTGSARLDLYRRGGDSLLGRYYLWRLHPFTLSEIPPQLKRAHPQEVFQRLMKLGGFPEPFLDGDETEARRWRRDRLDRLIREDIRDLEPIRDMQTLRLFVEALRQRVGQLVVLSNLAEDLQVAQKTLKYWLEILERLYIVFTIRPHTDNIARAIQKPPKVFFYDNADVPEDNGARFENLVASHLLKRIHFLADSDGHDYELRYLRDKEKREVDFVIVRNGKVIELVEAKWSDRELSRSLTYYAERIKPEKALQIVGDIKQPRTQSGIPIEPAWMSLSKPLSSHK